MYLKLRLLMLIVLPCVCAAVSVSAQPAPFVGLDYLGKATVAEIVDGDTVVLESGQHVRLVGIQAPKLPLGRRGFDPWPKAQAAKAKLATLVLGKTVHLWGGGTVEDRHGRMLAHLFIKSTGGWVQRQMLLLGYARVYSFADNRRALAPLYQAEHLARNTENGIWEDAFYAIQQADDVSKRSGFEIVEGTVQNVSHFHSFTYLNFGPDWKTDFTIRISPKNRRNFGDTEAEGKAWLDALRGKAVRVRGWLFQRGGPMIEISHAEAIELLPDGAK